LLGLSIFQRLTSTLVRSGSQRLQQNVMLCSRQQFEEGS
jgi:hypothetical protein